MYQMILGIAGRQLQCRYDHTKPQTVFGPLETKTDHCGHIRPTGAEVEAALQTFAAAAEPPPPSGAASSRRKRKSDT